MSDKLSTPPELIPVVDALDKFAHQLQWVCLDAVASPTPEQLQALQTFFPEENLLGVRRRLIEGKARVGPFIPDTIDAFCQAAFAPHGLLWHTESPSPADLVALGVEPNA